jgi:biopolymer transport protein TolR
MGMSTGGGDKKGVSSEINVTPLIDVLLVLLIIFLVVMPIMMRMETIEVPRKIENNETVDQNVIQVTITVKTDLSVGWNDGTQKDDIQIQSTDVVRRLSPLLLQMAERGTAKVVFVAFDCGVQWKDVISMMDTIRSLAKDQNHDEIKVALKVKGEDSESQDKCH